MAAQRKSRDDWIAAGFEALGEHGVDKVRIDRIAATLGVTKGSFYWHFTDREELLDAVVEGWERGATEELIAEVDASRSDPRARVHRLWELAGDPSVIEGELAIRDWARRDRAVTARVGRVDRRRMDYVTALFTELGVPADEIGPRSLLFYSLLVGEHLIAGSHPRRSRAAVAEPALTLLLGVG